MLFVHFFAIVCHPVGHYQSCLRDVMVLIKVSGKPKPPGLTASPDNELNGFLLRYENFK